MKHIGIVACSAEGAALCYRTIAQEAESYVGEHNHPVVTMHSIPLADWMPAFNVGDYGAVGELMLQSARVVAQAGAQFAICPDNSCHLSWDHFIPRSPIPWLHIGEVVAAEAKSRGFKKAALLGTRFTMSGPMYRDVFRRHGMEVLSPGPQDEQFVDHVIFAELVHGDFRESSRLRYNEVIARLKTSGCDCVILGCTEIPLLVRADDCPLPTLDSTRLLAKAAVGHAIAGDAVAAD
ncbi:MAG: amino acid racemase [Acidobacteria bacterium]|nr:amino acid racemase [Acidobacteriota bacterium]